MPHQQKQHERGPDGDRDERGVGDPRCAVGGEAPPAEPEGQIAEYVEQAGRAGYVQRDEHHLGGTEHGRADGEGVLAGDAPDRRRQEHDRHGHDALGRLDEAQERFPPHRGRHRNGRSDGDTADGHEPHIPSRPDEFARPEGLADGGHRAAHGSHRQSHEHHMALGDQADGCLHFRADAPARPHVGDADDELTEQHDALRPGQVPDGVDAFGVQFHMGMGVGGLMEAYAPCRPAQDDERREARNQGSVSIGSEEALCLPYSQKHPHPPLCFRAMGAAWCGAVSADVSFRSGAGRSSRIPDLLSACS